MVICELLSSAEMGDVTNANFSRDPEIDIKQDEFSLTGFAQCRVQAGQVQDT